MPGWEPQSFRELFRVVHKLERSVQANPRQPMTPISYPAPEPNFDRVARLYRFAEYLTMGPLLQLTRNAHLGRFSGCRQALLFGDGDGRFLAGLLARYPGLHAVAADTSSVMLRLLAARCQRISPAGTDRLTIFHGSVWQAPVSPDTDLIVTHFFLDCFTQKDVDSIAARLSAAVQPGTLWLLSDFGIPTAPGLRGAARASIRALYLVFRLLTGLRVESLPDPQTSLVRGGFRRLARKQRLFGLLYSELWMLGEAADAEQPGCVRPHPQPMAPHPPEHVDAPDPQRFAADTQPDPEPAVPSLPEPDPGVFHHEPGASVAE